MDWTAIIPIRQGSKGLPGKNTIPLGGLPLYLHSVEHAKKAGASRIIISTNIPEVLRQKPIEKVQVIARPDDLCQDSSTMDSVIAHAVEQKSIQGICGLLQATSPLRAPEDITNALEIFGMGEFDLVMSVREADNSVLKWGIEQDCRFVPFSNVEYCFANRQELPAVVRPNGAIYIFDAARFIKVKKFSYFKKIGIYKMDQLRSIDIDSKADLEKCESVISS